MDRLEEYIAAIAEPIIQRKNPSRSRWERAADEFETHPISRLAIGLGAVLTTLSVFGVAATALGVWYQYKSNTEERVARAWQTVSGPAAGNSGKGQAIEFLHERGENLVGIHLGGASKANGAYISGLKLQDAIIDRPNLSFAELKKVDFEHVHIQMAKAHEAFITGKFKNSGFLRSELVNATLGFHSGTRIGFSESLLDGLYLHTDYLSDGEPLENINDTISGKNLTSKYPKLSVHQSSLRCAKLAYYPITSFNFDDVDISGAYFDFYGFTENDSHLGSWQNLKGAW